MGVQNGERISLKQLRFPKNIESKSTQSPQQVMQEVQQQNIASKQLPLQDSMQKTLSQKPVQKPLKPSKEIPQPMQESTLSSKSLASQSPSIYDYGITQQMQEIKELYGEEFGALSPNQQIFIKSNLDSIGRITQRYLRYPAIAGKIGQEGENVLEFMLHPNGDISDLKLLSPSGYKLLDDNSLHTIRIAYKDYPYPNEKTKIRIRVMYKIY